MKKMLCVITLYFSQYFYGVDSGNQNFDKRSPEIVLQELAGKGFVLDEDGRIEFLYNGHKYNLHIHDKKQGVINFGQLALLYSLSEAAE